MKNSHLELKKRLDACLQLNHSYLDRFKIDRQEVFPASVLLLFALDHKGEVNLLFVRRADHIQVHQGQMAFPGGRGDPADLGSRLITALRETEEEVGILRDQIEVLGSLPVLHTVTGFEVEPFVGVLKTPLESVTLRIDPQELAEAIWISLGELAQPFVYTEEIVSRDHQEHVISIYLVRNYRIWGATGAMTKNILDRYFQISSE